MPQTISISIPDAIADHYSSPLELQKSVYEDIIVRAFQKGELSIRQSAKLLEMTYDQFLGWLADRKISFINATEDELNESYAEFESFMHSYNKK